MALCYHCTTWEGVERKPAWSYVIFLPYSLSLHIFPNPGGAGRGAQVCKYYNLYILQRSLFPGCLHFDLVSSAYHDISCIFPCHCPMVFKQFPMIFMSSVLRCFPAFSHAFPTRSQYFPPLYAVFLHFPMFSACRDISCVFTVFPNSFLRFILFSYIFQCVCSACHDTSYFFTIFSSLVRCFPAFFHVFAFVSTAYRHISCVFTVF